MRPNTFVAVEVESDDGDVTSVQLIESLTQQSVINGPAEALDIAFFDADQGDGCLGTRLRWSLIGDQVVDHQIDGLGQACTAEQSQDCKSGCIRTDALQQFPDLFHPWRYVV